MEGFLSPFPHFFALSQKRETHMLLSSLTSLLFLSLLVGETEMLGQSWEHLLDLFNWWLDLFSRLKFRAHDCPVLSFTSEPRSGLTSCQSEKHMWAGPGAYLLKRNLWSLLFAHLAKRSRGCSEGPVCVHPSHVPQYAGTKSTH